MESKGKTILFVLVVAAVIAGGFYYFLRPEPLEDTSKESVVTRMAFSGTNLSETQDGKPIWDLTARVIEVDPKTKWIYLTDLKGTIYRTDGTKIDVLAKTAVVDPDSHNVEMTDGISMKTDDGATFSADKGRFAAKEHKIFASGSVRATREDAVLTGRELEVDDKFELIVVKGNARIVKGGPTQ